ncbi:DUF2281 domain-containing protein [Candidatus Arsenophonus triatominarum]|nr:DUF2281 domain-containing protein [Candidatus Arsenophonus triatominarum]
MPPDDNNVLKYDHKKFAELPWSAKEEIQDFIEFVIHKYHGK